MISAKVIAASEHGGHQITTLELVYPRFIHSEFMTHRAFSRNASSSRAIPVRAMIEQVLNEPARPVEWGEERQGMQAGDLLPEDKAFMAYHTWNDAANSAAYYAELLADLGVHKQITNRILEPFLHIRVVCTSTEWANFFNLRLHPDAQPEIRALAVAMKEAMLTCEYKHKKVEEWHLPYITDEEEKELDTYTLMHVSAARCARVSYRRSDGSVSKPADDIKLATRLRAAGHWSPFEHPAMAMGAGCLCDNFRGWASVRHLQGTALVEPLEA